MTQRDLLAVYNPTDIVTNNDSFIILSSQSCQLLASGYFRQQSSVLDNIRFNDLSNLVSKYMNINNDAFKFRIKTNHRYRMLFFPQK